MAEKVTKNKGSQMGQATQKIFLKNILLKRCKYQNFQLLF